jgi:deoxyhypusine synthase
MFTSVNYCMTFSTCELSLSVHYQFHLFGKVDAIVTTAGGIEEDFIKCLAPCYLGDFRLKGKELRANGVNRIGNLLIPNGNYCLFEDWLSPILNTMTDEQVKIDTRWSPSTFIDRLGKEINNEESVYYWAHKNKIPVFCPALTDGSIGAMLYLYTISILSLSNMNTITIRFRS